MKAKIDGIEVEGSVEEICKLAELLKGKQVEPQVESKKQAFNEDVPLEMRPIKWVTKSRPSLRGRKWWTKREDAQLRELVRQGMSKSEIAERMAKTSPSVNGRMHRLGLYVNRAQRKYNYKGDTFENIHSLNEPIKHFTGARAAIHNRAKSLVAQYQYSFEKALEMARDEWRARMRGNHNRLGGNKYGQKNAGQQGETGTLAFPQLAELSANANLILQGMLKQMARGQGKLVFSEASYTLSIETMTRWHRFIQEFMQKADKITAYVNQATGLKGKFLFDLNNFSVRYEG